VTRSLPILLLLAVALAASGCDSSADEAGLTEAQLVGTWEAQRATVSVVGIASPNLLAALEMGDRAEIVFAGQGAYTFLVDVEEPRTVPITVGGVTFPLTLDDSSFSGTYAIRSPDHMGFTIAGVPGEADVEYRYRRSSGELTLVVRNTESTRAVLAYLLGSEELAGLISSGEITFRQAASARLQVLTHA
jgi:hypothetical protein